MIDPSSETWMAVKAAAQTVLAQAQAALNSRIGFDETEYQRGRRDVAAEMLALETPRAPIRQSAAIEGRAGV